MQVTPIVVGLDAHDLFLRVNRYLVFQSAKLANFYYNRVASVSEFEAKDFRPGILVVQRYFTYIFKVKSG